MANAIKEEQFRQDIKAALERMRNGIRVRVPARDQAHFLDVVDRIQEFVMNRVGEIEQVQASIQRTKDTTRRLLRQKPVDMVQLLNELDGIESDVLTFFTQILSGNRPT
jgi:hypothetical protein